MNNPSAFIVKTFILVVFLQFCLGSMSFCKSVEISGKISGCDDSAICLYAKNVSDSHFNKGLHESLIKAEVKKGKYKVNLSPDNYLISIGITDKIVTKEFPLFIRRTDSKIRMDIELHKKQTKEESLIIPHVTFKDKGSVHQQVFDLFQLVTLEKEKSEIKKIRSRDSKGVKRVISLMKDEKQEAIVREYASLSLCEFTSEPFKLRLSEAELKEVLSLIPPESGAWNIVNTERAPGSVLFPFTQLQDGKKILAAFHENTKQYDLGFISAYCLASMYKHEQNEEKYRYYYGIIKKDFSDIPHLFIYLIFLDKTNNIVEGKPIPDFSLEDVDTKNLITKQNMLGTNYLIEFWATTCGPCRAEMENMHNLYSRFKDKNFTIISIAMERDISDLIKFREQHWEMPWRNVFISHDFNSKIAKMFEVCTQPSFILVDANGIIVDKTKFPYYVLTGETLEKALVKLLN